MILNSIFGEIQMVNQTPTASAPQAYPPREDHHSGSDGSVESIALASLPTLPDGQQRSSSVGEARGGERIDELLIRSSSAENLTFLDDFSDETGKVSSSKAESDAQDEAESAPPSHTLSGTGLFVDGSPRIPRPRRSSLRRRVSAIFGKQNSNPASAEEMSAHHIADLRKVYVNHLRELREANPAMSLEAITQKFISEVPAHIQPLLNTFGLDTSSEIAIFFEFLDLRRSVESKTVDVTVDPRTLSSKSPQDIISSFRCAEQRKPPQGIGNIPFFALNEVEASLPDPWEATVDSFFLWLFQECNALFKVDYPPQKLLLEFCEANDASHIPYIKALQSLTINAFAAAATKLLSHSTDQIQITTPHQEDVRYSYKIEFDDETQTFEATQIKVFLFKRPAEEKSLGQVNVYSSIKGKMGEDQVTASLQFKNLKFNMGRDISVWLEIVRLLDAIQ